MSPPSVEPPQNLWGPLRRLNHPVFHFASLVGLAIYFLFVSWRRWPDLIIDFGRELYIPWQLSQGAVLYRDVDDFYGPFSQYLNGCLFKIFGPGLMVLAWANLVVFAGIAVALYASIRAAWGAFAAWLASAIFIAIFGFSRLTEAGNFNYVTPYSHETTHGMLCLLLLLLALWRWSLKPTLGLTATAGVLFGLTLVLKPEIVLPGACLTLGAVWFVWRDRSKLNSWLGPAWVACAALPTTLFAIYFSRHVPFADAWSYSGRAWLNVIATDRYVADPAQLRYLGFDRVASHLVEHAAATVFALGIFASIAGLAWLADRASDRRVVMVGLGLACPIISFCAWTYTVEGWRLAARCFLGLHLLYGLGQLVGHFAWPSKSPLLSKTGRLRLLLNVLAVTLLARMALNGRLTDFGYYQAAIAAVVLPAIFLGELPTWFHARAPGRIVGALCLLSLLVPSVVRVARGSARTYAAVNYPVGEGRDRFFAITPSHPYPLGPTITGLIPLMQNRPPDETLLVLPEGLMLNYLARIRSPLPHFFYYSAVTEHGLEKKVVEQLSKNPPRWVVFVSRPLNEYGIDRYGERSGAGAEIVHWLEMNYLNVGMKNGRPMTLEHDGAFLLRKAEPGSR